MSAALLLGGCGGQQGTPTTTARQSQQFNQADVAFAQQVIVHHHQAVMMADVAEERAQDPRVRQLAARIKAEQQQEMRTVSSWLQEWGQAAASMSQRPRMSPHTWPRMSPHMSPHMSPSHGMPYTIAPGRTPHPEISEMMRMHGVEFDRTFLRMMIAHHEQMNEIAQVEQRSGQNPQARQLAEHMAREQRREAAQMQQMLDTPAPRPS